MVLCAPMITIKRISIAIWLTIIALGLFACGPQTTILVYITATPDIPTDTPTQINTLPPLPTETLGNPDTPTRTPQVVGAVVGDDYTLEPSNTPRATRTPQPTATPEITIPPRPSITPTGPTPTPFPVLNRDQVGVQLFANHGRDEWDFSINRTKELGVGWIKVQANWSFLQQNGANADDTLLRLFELNLQTADQAGFKILMSIAKAPSWARPGSAGADAPPDNPQELANFLNLMFQNTKIGEVVDAIEIWNEPNLRSEWNTDVLPFNGGGYMRLFTPAYNAIRAYRSDIIVITAGLSPTITGGGSVDDREYLRQMYNAGLGSYVNDPNLVIGVHPYGWGNPPDARCCGDANSEPGWDDNPHFFFLENLDATREIMNANGHQNGKMWATEFGWAVWEDIKAMGYDLPDPQQNYGWMYYTTANQQLDYTIRALEIGQTRGDIGLMVLWNLNFANRQTIENRQEIIAFSLLFPDLKQDDPNKILKRPLGWLLGFAFATPTP